MRKQIMTGKKQLNNPLLKTLFMKKSKRSFSKTFGTSNKMTDFGIIKRINNTGVKPLILLMVKYLRRRQSKNLQTILVVLKLRQLFTGQTFTTLKQN